VGIAFALVAVILVSVASTQIGPDHRQTLLWTTLSASARQLDPDVMLAAFIFALIGFGTKAGIAPMHTWLPDAHSQAPTPVSSVFSGVMLSCAFFGILRYVSISEASLQNGEPRQLLLIFGLLSMAIAAVFIMSQSDLKRLLAYSSIEHIGIICVGVGLGGLAVPAALLHTVGHSLAKVIAFCGAGRIVQAYATRQMGSIRGAVVACPLWGIGFFAAMAVLIGVAPGVIFITELRMVLQAVADAQLMVALIFIACCGLVFITALRQVLAVGFGEPVSPVISIKSSRTEGIMLVAVLIAIGLGGFWIPAPAKDLLVRMAAIVGGGQ
jgi:hydrogenase-4 component F